MTAAAKLAELVLQELGIDRKPDLDAVCKRLGIRVREVSSTAFDGTLVRSRSAQKGIIAVRASIPEHGRKRFTVAHEIGHFVIPHHRLLKNICRENIVDSYKPSLRQEELEANEFAGAFLLPTRAVVNRWDLKEPSLHDISSVADEFETSLTATARRFVDLTEAAMVLLWQTAGKVDWLHKSIAFRYYLPVAELPAPSSMAGRLFAGEAVPDDFEPIDPSLWLDRRDADKVQSLREHSVLLPNYSAVLTLLLIEHGAPAEEAEELLEVLDPDAFTLDRKRWPR
jgi:Zn-dependent peptidase ImmA (M78 family)